MDILAVEHRCFFNQKYRKTWDVNKKVKDRHNILKQGLCKQIGTETDFEKSIIYEAYDEVFAETVALNL